MCSISMRMGEPTPKSRARRFKVAELLSRLECRWSTQTSWPTNTHGAHRSSHVMHAVLLEKRRVDPNAQRPETLVGREQRAKPPPKNREPTPCAPCDSRDRPSVREVLRTTGVGGLVASWSADFGCSSDGGLLGRGVAVGSNNATVESACSKRASYSPNLLEGVFSEVLRGRS